MCIFDTSAGFTMNGGTIIGNSATDGKEESGRGGGVYDRNGEFTMNGGSIIGNCAKEGGGVYVWNGGKFTMNGGIITGNTADTNGGGVSQEAKRLMYLSGDPVIIGNKVGENDAADDIYLYAGQTITITDELKLPDGATTPKIGITMELADVFTSGYSDKNPNKAPSVYFISNDDDYLVAYDNGKEEDEAREHDRLCCGQEHDIRDVHLHTARLQGGDRARGRRSGAPPRARGPRSAARARR